MQNAHRRIPWYVAALFLGVMIESGCNSTATPTDQLFKRQAEQQDALSRQQMEITKASQSLVSSDAQARREMIEFQAKLQTEVESERQAVSGQRDELEQDRRAIAHQRYRDPLIAEAIAYAATLLLSLLPIIALLQLLKSARDEPAEIPLSELLISDYMSDDSLLIPHTPSPMLPGPEGPDERGQISIEHEGPENGG